jgi:hypothetical protein
MTETNTGAPRTCCLCDKTTPATKSHALAGPVCDTHFAECQRTDRATNKRDATSAGDRRIPWPPDSTEARLRNVDKWIGEADRRQAGRE